MYRLLWHGHQVMYNQLASWMVYGILNDQHGEFFISRCLSVPLLCRVHGHMTFCLVLRSLLMLIHSFWDAGFYISGVSINRIWFPPFELISTLIISCCLIVLESAVVSLINGFIPCFSQGRKTGMPNLILLMLI